MWKIVLVGGIGGALPNLVDKLAAWNEGTIHVWLASAPNIWIAILVAIVPVVLYFLIGAVVAAVYENQSLQKALLLGLGAPAFIVASANTAGTKTPEAIRITDSGVFAIFSVAHAQTGVGGPDVKLNIGKLPADCERCQVKFLGPDGNTISTAPLTSPSGESITVPDGVNIIEFTGADANPVELDLRQLGGSQPANGGAVTLDVDVNRSYWNDLNRSLGVKNVQPFNFDVRVGKP